MIDGKKVEYNGHSLILLRSSTRTFFFLVKVFIRFVMNDPESFYTHMLHCGGVVRGSDVV